VAKNPNGTNSKAQGNVGSKGVVSMDRPESEFIRCNVEFGKYNPLGSSEIFNVPYQNKTNLGFFARANIAIEKTNFSGILPEKGPYVAIVLKIESNQVDKQLSNEGWAERTQGDDLDPIISIKARIPELHAHIPIPNKFQISPDSQSNSAYDQLSKSQIDNESAAIINMYPTFICKPDANNQPPQVGSLVWVDFNDKYRINGIYLGTLSSKTSAKTKEIYGKSSKSFDSGSKVDAQSLGANKAMGQTNSSEPNIDTQVAKAGIL
tara:strand:- start:470 stop:1261 length:792 start_codon:yes stop_codon:yes gene_type:complete